MPFLCGLIFRICVFHGVDRKTQILTF